MLPHIAVRGDIKNGTIVSLPWERGTAETALMMIHHQSKWISLTLSAFMSCLEGIYSVFSV